MLEIIHILVNSLEASHALRKKALFGLYYYILCCFAVYGFFNKDLEEMSYISIGSLITFKLNHFATVVFGGLVMWFLIVPKILAQPRFLLFIILGFIIHLHAFVGLIILTVGVDRDAAYDMVEKIIFGSIAFLLGN